MGRSLQPGRRGRVAAGDLKPGAYAYVDTYIMRNYAESCKPFLWGGRRGSDAGASYPAPRPADQFAVRPAARTPRAALVSPAARTPVAFPHVAPQRVSRPRVDRTPAAIHSTA